MPADGTPDAYPLRLASKILSDGESSRIYTRLIYDKQIAVQAESSGNFTEDPNLFFVFAVMNGGHSPAEGETQVEAELTRLKTELVSDADLEKAKNQILRDFILSRQTAAKPRGRVGIRGRGSEGPAIGQYGTATLSERHAPGHPARGQEVFCAGEQNGGGGLSQERFGREGQPGGRRKAVGSRQSPGGSGGVVRQEKQVKRQSAKVKMQKCKSPCGRIMADCGRRPKREMADVVHSERLCPRDSPVSLSVVHRCSCLVFARRRSAPAIIRLTCRRPSPW